LNSLAILIDFGSTFTKVTAVQLDNAHVVGMSQAPSTVLTDVREGLLQALVGLHERHVLFDRWPNDLSILDGNVVLASSSAAGGLRIVVIGLVPGLTVQAANQAALGAGAKVVGSLSFKLADKAIQEIDLLRPDMILLTGGTNGGDSETILHNTRLLARSQLSVPIVVAGNRAVSGEVCEILRGGGNEIRLADNVMPKAGTLAVESAREEIRKLFMERITHAKGLDALKGIVPVVLPTPMAVLEGVQLGADGVCTPPDKEKVKDTEKEGGWGDMLVVDVGGATTDVHSIGYGHPAGENVIAPGLAEPYAKRTVEGDLGIRFNAATILDRVGLDKLAGDLRADFPGYYVRHEELRDYIEQIVHDTGSVPREKWHTSADAVLARNALDLAVARHVGRRERIITREGETWVHYGKDLRETRTLIGTGGVFVYNPHTAYILAQPMASDDRVQALRPKHPKTYLDSSYILYAVGLLARSHPAVALRIFAASMKPVEPRQTVG
jgi:uncharacterized protein (TIGR01319 family)